MSAYTTLRISRENARRFLIDKIANGLSDSELEEMVDKLLEKSLYNVVITSDTDQENQDRI